jgi:hypothetical protein
MHGMRYHLGMSHLDDFYASIQLAAPKNKDKSKENKNYSSGH